ncbi:MAG: flavin-dependent oxidoreductase [Caulobacterales bacterium]|uniref:flavin-dependent oxidoreductase n=1 Tax=Glycocaulis sp. TaxID=1969725 RepID=UPI003FA0B89A
MEVAIIGGGIVGLALALGLQQRGIKSRVYEAAPEIREIGVGITLLPHAMRELTALNLGEEARSAGIELHTSAFYNRFGQKIYSEPRGLAGGSPYPEVSIHRGRLHTALYKAALERLGADRIHTDCQLAGFQQDEDGVTLAFRQTSTGESLPPVRASIAIGCDGVNSVTRKLLYPDDKVVFTGINTWRGTTRRKPILDGRTYLRIGSIRTGKMVIYPIIDDIDGDGNQLINWVAEIEQPTSTMNDWNQGGKVQDFLPVYQGWKFEWLDVEKLILDAGTLLEYPMVDKDPLDRWTFGRVTLAGDAAHPMYPRGSNGSAQGLIDARTLSDCLAASTGNPQSALKAYEAARLEPTGQVVRANRSSPPDIINIRVEELTGDRPFDNLDDFISHDELKALSEQYKRVAGFSSTDLTKP